MGGFDDIRGLDAPLEEKLRAYEAQQRESDPAASSMYDAFVARLEAGSVAETTPKIGDTLAPFVLPDVQGRFVSSKALLKDGPLVVSFNRGTWCTYCLLELTALADAAAEIRALGASVVSVMPDRAARTKTICEAFDIPFPVLTDIDNGYALGNGLMISLGPDLQQKLVAAGVDLEESQGNDSWFVPVPATYIVAPDGTIVAGGADVDFRRRYSIEKVLDDLRELKTGASR